MIGIVYYGAGNIFSLTATLDRLGLDYGMIGEPRDFEKYDRYIIPGVGHAGAAMKKLEQTGLVPYILKLKKPVLGICVGMQLLTEHSEEGDSPLLGLVPVRTRLFDGSLGIKVPHTGWNRVDQLSASPLLIDIEPFAHFYFVHSYFIEFNPNFTIALAEYGIRFSAVINKDNFYGVQFHPEKSGHAGEQLLRNFSYLA